LTSKANVEFLRGQIEDIPLPAGSVDVVISNCVINLLTNKPAGVRVDVPGAQAERPDRCVRCGHREPSHPSGTGRARRVGCIAGALSMAEYERGLVDAGFVDVAISPTHEVAEGMHSAIVRARKPEA
jgi:hypothetical protein